MNEKEIKFNIRSLRQLRHISQQEMADLLNVERNTYRNIENGSTRIFNPILPRIAEILEVSVMKLLAGYELQEDELKTLEEMKVDYASRFKDTENTYRENLNKLQKELTSKEEELKKVYEWLEDKNQIISLLKKRLSEESENK